MVFLGLEKPVEYGRQQIFDPTTAQMVLQAQDQYANALYRDYVRGLEDMKEFNKEYGNFITPILADQEWYNKNVIGKVKGTIQRMYEAGIDPTRSVQGRAAITQLINSIDVGSVNKLRSSRDAANEYIKNRGLLEAKGLYNADLEERYLGHDLSRWDTIGGGQIWDRTSPVEAKTLKELTESWYDNRTPEILTPEDVASLGLQYEKGYDYTGFADRHLLNIAAGETPGWTGSVYSDYFRDLAERKVAASGRPYTKADVERQLQQDIATANREYKGATREANQFALDDYRTNNDIRAHRANAAIDHYYKTLENGDGDGNGVKNTKGGWNVAEDVYVTSLAKAAGEEYLPQGGVSPQQQTQMLKVAEERQLDAIRRTGDVLTATGMFIAPEKIGGLIQSTGKNGNGYFLNPSYFKNLHTIDELRTSCRGAFRVGINISNPFSDTPQHVAEVRKQNKQRSKDVVHGIKNDIKANKEDGFRLKVVQANDENDNNVYSFIGDDNRWHTYALVRVYMSDGKTKTRDAGNSRIVDKKKVHDIPKEGVLMGLEVGLRSNEESGTPDLSVTARENLGFYGYDKTTKEVGRDANSGFPYATNTLKH